MLKTSLFFISFLAVYFLNAQISNGPDLKGEKTIGKNEIGINLYNITDQRRWYYLDFSHNFCNGLIYKKHFGRGAYRIGVDYFHNEISITNDRWYDYYNQKNSFGELRMGYEVRFLKKKFQPYIGADLMMAKGNIKVASGMWGDIAPGYFEQHYNLKINEFGVVYLAGLRYQFQKRISIAAEANITAIFVKYSNPMYRFNPLRAFTFNYHF